MTALFRLFDVDYIQWKAVSRTLLRSDFRLPLVEPGAEASQIAGLLSMFLFLSLFGLSAAIVVFVGRDVLLTGVIALSYLSVMLTTSLLTQHSMTLLSTTDYVILGSRPVSSGTFFAIRLTNVLFHTAVITVLIGYPVVLAYLLVGSVSVSRALASAAAILAWSLTVALAIVAFYGTLLRRVGPGKLQRALGYLQLGAGFLAYGGLLISGRALGSSSLAHATMVDAWWVTLIPPAWFASYIELANGTTNSTTAVRAVLSLAAPALLTVTLRGKLGSEYARRLGELPHVDVTTSTAIRTPLFAAGESRAAAILVLAHFRHDLRVRLGVFGVLPLIAINLFIDPAGPVDLIALAVLLFPAVLTQHFATSDAYRASWIFAATPVDRARLIVAVKNVAIVYFVVPFLVLVAAVYTWRTGGAAYALVHTAMLGMLSQLALQAAAVIAPRLPFALPPSKTHGQVALMAWMMVVMIGGQLALFALHQFVYGSTPRTAVVFVTLALLTWLMNRAIGWRLRHGDVGRHAT